MKVAGIIVEYNPLHNGHMHHFQQTKLATGADAVVAVMSGHFLQRGEPALANKWARAEMALRMGADLVIELPVAFSAQPAEWFAYGAVTALARTGIVDSLCFGSEAGNLAWLERNAERLSQESTRFRAFLKQQLKTGSSYPAAYTAAAAQYMEDGATSIDPHQKWIGEPGEHGDLSQWMAPNNTLGLHYLIALRRSGSRIRPYTIPRTKAQFGEQTANDASIASATAIRRMLDERSDLRSIAPYVPEFTLSILQDEIDAGRAPIHWECFREPLLHTLVSSSKADLAHVYEMNEGLENRIVQAIASLDPYHNLTVQSLLAAVKTKRYTLTKLQRTFTRILLRHFKSDFKRSTLEAGTPYLRILGFSAAGRDLLKTMKRTASVPIIVNVSKNRPPLLELDIRSTSVYALAYRETTREQLLRDYYQAPVQV